MAKKTKYVTLQGKSKWVHLDHPDTKFDAAGKWTVCLYHDQASNDKILELKKEGLKNTLKKDDDGPFMVWSRPTQRTYAGKLKAFAPPDIFDREGIPLPRTTKIGHGSDITITLEIYYYKVRASDATDSCAARLASVRIDNLVPYVRSDLEPKQQRVAAHMDKADPQPAY